MQTSGLFRVVEAGFLGVLGSTGDGVTRTTFAGGTVNVTSITVLAGNISSLPSAVKLVHEYRAPFPLDSNSPGEGELGSWLGI